MPGVRPSAGHRSGMLERRVGRLLELNHTSDFLELGLDALGLRSVNLLLDGHGHLGNKVLGLCGSVVC